jgi:FkbM family methyltransferase
MDQLHPSICARIARALRSLRVLPGWERVVATLVPADAAGRFVVVNSTGLFAGDLSSFIDRRMYLFGEYEQGSIGEFISKIPDDRRGTILDIGANVGTHSLAFAQHFGQVHAFEPNPNLWKHFERNIALNNLHNVQLHKVGLGGGDAELPFYLIDKKNYGLGTFSRIEQYDLPLKEVGRMTVVTGDGYIKSAHIAPVDAIKIDVQGFELEVVRGLADVLAKDRPFVWLEVSADTRATVQRSESLRGLFPFQSDLFRFEPHRSGGIFHSMRLRPASPGRLDAGDYLIAPLMPIATP